MGRPAIDLTVEQAREIRDELNKNTASGGALTNLARKGEGQTRDKPSVPENPFGISEQEPKPGRRHHDQGGR